PLLGREYRSGCWSPHDELAGGVAQAQGTVQRGIEALGIRLPDLAEDGSELPGEFTYLLRPRSYLIVGHLAQLVGQEGGHHLDRIRSFELFRRHLLAPEVITFDELLARAEWLLEADTDGGP
ncbi:MAG TPA: Shedu immune nuclease family protein, partial [Jiangellaceae bacterium]|nr:Shedu immune nuclease family protein [Jiangellaceae bacterium]